MTGLSVNSIANSLAATHQVQRTYASIADTLTQLSTGSRINSAKDDPAGLIAQELMRAEITASNAAIKNTQLANAMLNVAESGMRQISTLLNEAKGLTVEAANTGAMSSDMVQANQDQMNQILNSIDRISGSTQWLGKNLLDGTLSSENGGALFQLGPDVVSSQQVSVPIESVRTTEVGGDQGTLANLLSGQAAALASNPGLADSVINSAITQIATQRAAIGATQKYTLDSNLTTLQDSVVQLTGSLSLISDTDFAEATSNLLRDQILLQAGVSALGLTNNNSAYAAQLIR